MVIGVPSKGDCIKYVVRNEQKKILMLKFGCLF